MEHLAFNRWLLLTALLLSLASFTQAQTPATTQPAKTTTQPADAQAMTNLPHIRINRQKHWVDFDAKVANRDGKWIELLVCTPGTREYEAILTTQARPSHIHLALLILGQSPGSPQTWRREGDNVLPIAPTGSPVKVTIRYLKDHKTVEVPAGQWVMDHNINATWAKSIWLFAGSKFLAVGDKPVYLADVNGSCISLVNFGDDLLTRPTNTTNHNDGGQLAANTPVIPPVGTQVVIRLTPVKPAPAATSQPATQPAAQP